MKTLLLLCSALSLIVAAGCSTRSEPPVQKGTEAGTTAAHRAMVSEGALLLDVRTPAEFEQEHLPGAVNIPISELESRMDEVEAYREKGVVHYCAHGARSGRAGQLLKKAGIKTHDLKSIKNW